MFSYKHNSSSSFYHGNDILHEAYCKKGLIIRRALDLQYISTGTCTCKYTVQILINSSSTIILFVPSEHLNKRSLFLGTVLDHYIFKFELAENLGHCKC